MLKDFYGHMDIKKLYGSTVSRSTINTYEKESLIPPAVLEERKSIKARRWKAEDLPKIGQKVGFLKDSSGGDLKNALGIIYSNKGGVFKSTLALNYARATALHNIKTCLIGIDSQADITRALGHHKDLDETQSLNEAMRIIDEDKGLYHLFKNKVTLKDILCKSDIPTLYYIPETHEITDLTEELYGVYERDSWLEDSVIQPLFDLGFQLILIDSNPTGGRLVKNAIASADLLISPLQCKINHYRGFETFPIILKKTQKELKIDYLEKVYIPTGLCRNKKLSREIYEEYLNILKEECSETPFAETSLVEDAMLNYVSIFEYAPTKPIGKEMRSFLSFIHNKLLISLKDRSRNYGASVRHRRISNLANKTMDVNSLFN